MVLMVIPVKDYEISAREEAGIGITLHMNIEWDIDENYRELKQNCVLSTEDLKDGPYGVRDFSVEDPDGYLLAFTGVTTRQCLSCGMLIRRPDDFGGGNPAIM